MQERTNLYKRISLEFVSSFPGQVYLRFEPFGKVPAIMIQVLPADIVAITKLGEPYIPNSASTPVRKTELATAIEADWPADDDFQPGDS